MESPCYVDSTVVLTLWSRDLVCSYGISPREVKHPLKDPRPFADTDIPNNSTSESRRDMHYVLGMPPEYVHLHEKSEIVPG